MLEEYYLVTQEINKRFTSKFKIGCPTNITLFKKLLDAIPGYLTVHLVDSTNKKKNLTQELGRSTFDYTAFRKEYDAVGKYRLTFPIGKGSWVDHPPVVFYALNSNAMPEKFFLRGHPCSINFTSEWGKSFELDHIDQKKESHFQSSGSEYEKFIGAKYEETGYEVVYNGIERGVHDGGIDLIATKDGQLTLVQCKNWIDFEGHKLTSKDFRAYLGDCYLYLLRNRDISQVAYHYIVSDYEMIGTSGRFFLDKHPFVKCKVIPFEGVANNET